MQTKRNVIIGVIIVLVVIGLVYYKYYFQTLEPSVPEQSTQVVKELDLVVSKEVNALATYTVPNGEDKLRFTLALNKSGEVVGVKTTDTIKPEEVNANLEKFDTNLLVAIKGKKLSTLNNVDKVGTSSLTTDAFNKVLGELKAQI